MINANEQRVIDVAGGTFEYQGELYTVRETYLGTLKSKLDESDIELTAEQADKAVSAIFGNVERGVKEGYLKKLSGEEAEEAKEQGEVRPYSELGLSDETETGETEGSGTKTSETETGGTKTGEAGTGGGTEGQRSKVVTGRDGESYPVQQTPLQMNELETLRTSEIEAVQSYTGNEQIAGQLKANEQNMAVAMGVSWALCIVILTIYLKKWKHRRKAFLVMLGASLMSLAILVAGSVYMYNSWAYSPDTWQTAAVESGYFRECSKLVHKDLQKVFSGIRMEAGVELLALDDSVVYRDAKSIFTARLTGKELPKLEKRRKEIEEVLRLVLVSESNENIDRVSGVVMERYRKVLDTPYAAWLYKLRQSEQRRNVILIGGCAILLLLSIVLIWRGSKYIHRKFRGISYGIGMAGVSFIASNLAALIWGRQVQAEPEAYQALFRHYVNWRGENIFYFGILMLFVSVFTWGAAYVTKKSHIEKQGLK